LTVKEIICFIDDSAYEHSLVSQEIAAGDDEHTFVQATTFDEAVELLGDRAPALFLLDLWGSDPDVRHPAVTPKEVLQEKAALIPDLESVFRGLDRFPGDRGNEYLKRLFRIVDGWRTLFEYACAGLGQNRKYGLANLERVRSRYPGTPAVFYTRKSLISDAVAMFRAGCDGLFIKPTGRDDAETRRMTREYAPRLLRDLNRIIQTSGTRTTG
jgi:DNA-binding NarL/FixJ family response regulator